MRRILFCLPLFLSPLAMAVETEPTETACPAPDSHAEIADALTDLLHRTTQQLEQCTDSDSLRAAAPALQALRAEAAELMQRQAALPEPTVQDYMAAQNRANDFLDAKRAIQQHITRLQENGILTPEMREILGIAPEKGSKPE